MTFDGLFDFLKSTSRNWYFTDYGDGRKRVRRPGHSYFGGQHGQCVVDALIDYEIKPPYPSDFFTSIIMAVEDDPKCDKDLRSKIIESCGVHNDI
jgi:hypothetical protein